MAQRCHSGSIILIQRMCILTNFDSDSDGFSIRGNCKIEASADKDELILQKLSRR